MTELTARIVQVLKAVPYGCVVSYGEVAARAGNPRGARAVVRVLSSLSEREHLPWHRVVTGRGRIALRPGGGFELQKALLEDEGIEVDECGGIDLTRYRWR